MNGAVLQQVFVVEYTVQSHMCDDCHRVEAKDFWRAVVQIRQKVCCDTFVVIQITQNCTGIMLTYVVIKQHVCSRTNA